MGVTIHEPDDLPLLGLNEYEARAYRALLAEHPATAYRIAQRSGVPQSKVYETMARLVKKGAAILEPGRPTRYAPVPPDDLIAAARACVTRRLAELADDLREAYSAARRTPHRFVDGASAVLAQAAGLAASARELLVVAGSPQAVRAAIEASGPIEARVRTVSLPTGRDPTLVLLADSARALIGRLGNDADALVTDHPVLVAMLTDYLMHRAINDTAQDLASAQPSPAERRRRTDWQAWEEDKARRLLSVH
jgi:sugar-specific transcriptional regulator TrmB